MTVSHSKFHLSNSYNNAHTRCTPTGVAATHRALTRYMPGLKVPTPDELRDLRRLCGSDELVIAYLAKTLALPAESIASDVRGWLADLPYIPPPSRQRSAPAAPTQPLMARRAASKDQHKPEIMRVRTPPKSAPCRPSSAELIKEMSMLNLHMSEC
jgi:hypothetical protein